VQRILILRQFALSFFAVVIAFAIQIKLILPVERLFRLDNNADIVSLIFIPHGIKIALLLMFGVTILPAVFSAQLLIGFLMSETNLFDTRNVLAAAAGTLCLAIPLTFHNLSFRKPIKSAPMFDDENNTNNLWLFISFAFAASVLNSLFHSALNGFKTVSLPWMYLFGDVSGAILVFIILTFIFRPLILNLLRRRANHD
tara:strand:+ start:221 stop:817 length:597 start_codon:yes stop_codon:yes gene_type:complete